MKSLRFPSPVHPTRPKVTGLLIDMLRNHGAWTCRHGVIEGLGLTVLCPFLARSGNLAADERNLGRLLAHAYGRMATSPITAFMGSAMPFCLSDKPRGGHYFMHLPKVVDASTPVLLLFHGWGGNLLFFPWAISTELSSCIVIAPSWQIDWTDGSFEDRRRYVHTALKHAEAMIGTRLGRPWLVPLSQGGGMAFQLAGSEPERYQGIIGISSVVPSPVEARRIEPTFPVRLLHGRKDSRITPDHVRDTVIAIQRLGGNAHLTLIESANHFLLLSHRRQVGEFLASSIGAVTESAR